MLCCRSVGSRGAGGLGRPWPGCLILLFLEHSPVLWPAGEGAPCSLRLSLQPQGAPGECYFPGNTSSTRSPGEGEQSSRGRFAEAQAWREAVTLVEGLQKQPRRPRRWVRRGSPDLCDVEVQVMLRRLIIDRISRKSCSEPLPSLCLHLGIYGGVWKEAGRESG